MALAVAHTVALVGITGHVVEVEAHLAPGLPAFTLVGLPDASLLEARDRVRAAVLNSGQPWPQQRVTVNLTPAWLAKRGSSFDLAIAVAVLAGQQILPPAALQRTVLLGELGLDGRLRPVRGVLPAVIAAAAAGVTRVVVPEPSAAEARLVPDVEVIGLRSLRQLVALVRGEEIHDEREVAGQPAPLPDDAAPPLDLADVVGQPVARTALEIAAAGGHHLFLLGPPGAGKTMLAERLPGLLPDLEPSAALEVSAIHSVAGMLPAGAPLITRPPFQAPHHTATVAAVVGGGSGVPRPGAASLAHCGVLFLDEAPEFHGGVLDALRQPLEQGKITLARAGGTARYPARFRLVLAANPCPCGFAATPGADCACSPASRRRYLDRLSGPLLDRMDLRMTVGPVRRSSAVSDVERTTTEQAADRVRRAVACARERLRGTPWLHNAEVPGHEMRRRWPPQGPALTMLDRQLASGSLTMRGADRTLRVAWTLADLDGRTVADKSDVEAALALRDYQGGIAA